MTAQTPERPAPGSISAGVPGEPLPVQFKHEWCKKCGICIAFCPRKALGLGAKGLPQLTNPSACTQCRLCELLCPDFAIMVTPRKRQGTPAREGDAQ